MSLALLLLQVMKIKSLILVICSYSLSPWALDCGGGDVSPCVDPVETQLFPITSSVTFTDIPINTGPPKTRQNWPLERVDSSRINDFICMSCLTESNLECICFFYLFTPGFRSTSQSMTVTGMMFVGLSSPSPSQSITQVGITFVQYFIVSFGLSLSKSELRLWNISVRITG